MRKEVYEYISQNQELRNFIREQPHWYRKLSRNPMDLQSLEIASLHHYRKTIPHHVEKINNGVQMASMMMGMFQAMNSQS